MKTFGDTSTSTYENPGTGGDDCITQIGFQSDFLRSLSDWRLSRFD